LIPLVGLVLGLLSLPLVWVMLAASVAVGVLLRPAWSIPWAGLVLVATYLLLAMRDPWTLFFGVPTALAGAFLALLGFWIGLLIRRVYDRRS